MKWKSPALRCRFETTYPARSVSRRLAEGFTLKGFAQSQRSRVAAQAPSDVVVFGVIPSR
jgi:hypothetical protein